MLASLLLTLVTNLLCIIIILMLASLLLAPVTISHNLKAGPFLGSLLMLLVYKKYFFSLMLASLLAPLQVYYTIY